MTKEDLLNSDFFKQFSTPEGFNNFFSELYKRGIETMLEGEITAQLGYKKSSSRPDKTNARNGPSLKQLKQNKVNFK